MTFLRLYRLLAHQRKLAARRHPLWESNRLMRWFFAIVAVYYLLCLFIPGVIIGIHSHEGTGREGFDMVDGGMIILLAIDFLLRFVFFQTPAQDIKAYKLLPVSTKSLLYVFMLRVGLSSYNLIWMAFLLPLGLFAILPYAGWIPYVGWLVGWWLLTVMNGYWYLFWRTLIVRSWVWAGIPVVIYALLIYAVLFTLNAPLFCACVLLARGWMAWHPLAMALPLVGILLLFIAGIPLQRKSVYRELAQEEKTPQVKAVHLRWLDRFGVYGEYIKLEFRSIARNKVVRQQFITLASMAICFCLLLAFSDIYDQTFMRSFILVYCFCGLGGTSLQQLMCVEGNYIDLLMSRRESVLTLLRAKYLFHALFMIIPFCLLMVPVAWGKLAFIEVVGYCLFTLGVIFPLLFQCAVYNRHTLALNQKITRSQENSKYRLLTALCALFLPVLLLLVLSVCVPVLLAGILLSALGIIGIALSPWWIRNVYHRFLLRRHLNMEGFRQSRRTL